MSGLPQGPLRDTPEVEGIHDEGRAYEEAIEAARALCAVGQDLLQIRARGVPRWFVPLGGFRARYNGLTLYPAVSWRSSSYRAALRAWILAGGGCRTHRVTSCEEREWALGRLLRPDMPTLATTAVYVGLPGPDQKTTALLMDGQGRVLGYAKHARTARARALVANEARMLRTIPPNIGPRLIRFAPFSGGDLLVQTPVPGRARVPRLRIDAAQVRFLRKLEEPSGNGYPASEHPFVRQLYGLLHRSRRDLLEGVIVGLSSGDEWAVVRTHGDLAPWNMRLWRGEYRAFDWEYGGETGFPHLNAAHTVIQVAALVRHMKPQHAKRRVSEVLAAALPAGRARLAPDVASLSALNMLASWYPPRPPDAYERWLDAFIRAEA